MRVLLKEEPYLPRIAKCGWIDQGVWPCSWLAVPTNVRPSASAFRLRFRIESAAVIRVHVTADERYELHVDGARVGRGPERGDAQNWFFETYDLELEAGWHMVTARVWALGPASMRSQISLAPGFLFAPDDERFLPLLATGVAEWEGKELTGYEFTRPFAHNFFSVGYGLQIRGEACDWDWPEGGGAGWRKAEVLHPASSASLRNRYAPTVHLLRAATLPAMREAARNGGTVRHIDERAGEAVRSAASLTGEVEGWRRLVEAGESLEVPAFTSRRVILDLEDYVCAYSHMRLRGEGARVQFYWAESLFHEPEARTKGNRSEIEGKYFTGYGEVFLPSGAIARDYESLHWRAGRYLEIFVQTAAEPLVIEACGLVSTRFPLEPEAAFSSSDPSLEALMPLGIRALQASSHDSYMDGPYYEQMMWLGDGVQNTLTTYVLTRENRLARKLLRLFDSSRLPSGLTAARWPARDRLVIAPYSLLWVSIVRDYAFWKDDAAFVRSLLPGVRAIVDGFLGFLNPQGLMVPPMGWNFIDWVPGWPGGEAPGVAGAANAILNWQFVRTIGYAVELEEASGEPELASRARRKAAELARAIEAQFWDAERGLFADDLGKTSYSEHAQAEAILSGFLSADKVEVLRRTLFGAEGLSRTTISYSHYLFEAFRKLGRVDAMLQRLDLWRDLHRLGLYTTPEGPEPTRSDCHAWGAHPLYHFFATILGIQPASPNFRTVRIEPQLGSLTHARGTMPHPRGEIVVELEVHDGVVRGRVKIPEGVTGTLLLNGRLADLGPGLTEV